jgi:hypothetical protein
MKVTSLYKAFNKSVLMPSTWPAEGFILRFLFGLAYCLDRGNDGEALQA